MKKIISIVGVLTIALLTYKTITLNSELSQYRKTYDGLNIYEDGSWDFKGEEYFFWNWNDEK